MLFNEQESSVFAKWTTAKRRQIIVPIAIAALAISAYFIAKNVKWSETASRARDGGATLVEAHTKAEEPALVFAGGKGIFFPSRIYWACVDTCAIIAGRNSVHDTLVVRLMFWNCSRMPVTAASMKIYSTSIAASMPGNFKFRALADSLAYGNVPVNGFQPPFIQKRNFKFLVDSLASADPTKRMIGVRFQVAKIISNGSNPSLQDIATCATVWRPASPHATPIGQERTARRDHLRADMYEAKSRQP